jgi:tRNA (cytosine34-C5)-methyltransferase
MNGREGFKEYYKKNLNLSEEEFDLLLEYLDKPLPVTFRVNEKSPFLNQISKRLERYKAFVNKIPFINHTYQVNLSKRELKKNDLYSEFRDLLVHQCDIGGLSRQELVSMVPVLFLDVKEDSKVLDMCAAPGSKSTQIIELLHPFRGLLVCNDNNRRRVDILTTQTSRTPHPSLIITNNDSTIYPAVSDSNGGVLFDRVLCDVPCSGDGTVRKNPDIFDKWRSENSLGLFSIQYRTIKRGYSLLDEGGLLVYSTCSFNPIENECVIQKLLMTEEECELVDVSEYIKGGRHGLNSLKIREGLKTWNSCGLGGDYLPCGKDIGLERCIRIYPQDQDTGGFFVAVIKKRKKMKKITGGTILECEGYARRCSNNDPFYSIDETTRSVMERYVNISQDDVLLSQSKKCAVISMTTSSVYEIMRYSNEALRIISVGCKAFSLNDFKGCGEMSYRISPGMISLLDTSKSIIVDLKLSDARTILEGEFVEYSRLEKTIGERGPILIRVGQLLVSGWCGKEKMSALINKKWRAGMKQLLE